MRLRNFARIIRIRHMTDIDTMYVMDAPGAASMLGLLVFNRTAMDVDSDHSTRGEAGWLKRMLRAVFKKRG